MPSGLRPQRLRLPSDIRAVFAARRLAHGRSVVVHVADRGDALPARWTVVAGRKVGDAVRRNRAKRRIRAVIAEMELPVGTDIIVVARSAAQTIPFVELRSEVMDLLERAARGRRSPEGAEVGR